MMRTLLATAALTLAGPAIAQASHGHAAHKPAKPGAALSFDAALADANRPQADRDRDAARKPAALLAMLDLKPGAKVADFIMGGGYWTRILSNAVGPKGRVYAYQPAEFIQFMPKYGTDQDEAVKGRANVVALRDSLATVAFAEPLDAIVTVQNWHDLHLKMVPATFAGTMAKRMFAALKPGGVLLVVDHAGAAGQADSLHRGDKAGTRAEIEAAGFRLASESTLYANPSDPGTASVFAPSIRGKTDQFVLKFVKPR